MIYFASKLLYHFYAYINFVASMIMIVTALSIVASRSFASLHLYKEGILLVHPTPENLFQRVHYKFLCMEFQSISSKFSCATFQNLQILLIL
jgi:hypothetical protein